MYKRQNIGTVSRGKLMRTYSEGHSAGYGYGFGLGNRNHLVYDSGDGAGTAFACQGAWNHGTSAKFSNSPYKEIQCEKI